ncbi:hypothetical protein GCM10023185_25840 [Hymenobacter saemangeumensis]|uniref:Zf-HC2 domain-containing protein n=1 Tax=Hymenobacter saemangeumensis TaxID=1084522 RepID=A0ABP8II32_9BACT
MVRLITCQQAALLVAKRHDHALSAAQRAGLWTHLHHCRHCSRYARQSSLLAQLARHTALGPVRSPLAPVRVPPLRVLAEAR